ncbi:hypothetical protein E2C01_073716 [Portunus trituberculatus]|uniref:Uncharacterized protein n=1 Tax=Portunus trituberculatus TaxID=210409 RepID=A0A5B7I1F9_PORTR|nr:hypothetical protein [Portunus trituberculatus]
MSARSHAHHLIHYATASLNEKGKLLFPLVQSTMKLLVHARKEEERVNN